MKYDYQFAIHPGSRVQLHPFLRRMWAQTTMQVETFTEQEFAKFKMELDNEGWELHEVTRVPYHEPEIVRYWE